MLNFLAQQDYAIAWITAPIWMISVFFISKRYQNIKRISRLKYWSLTFTIGILLVGLLPIFWIITEINLVLGLLFLGLAIFLSASASAWLALGRTRDMGESGALQAAFSWFPIVNIFTIFGAPIDKLFASPTWGHFAKRFSVAVLLPLIALILSSGVWLFLSDRMIMAQIGIPEISRDYLRNYIADQINSQSPSQIDQMTTLLGAEINEGTLFYIYELTPEAIDRGSELFKEWTQTYQLQSLCKEGTLMSFDRNGIDVSLAYVDNQGGIFTIVDLDANDC